MRVARWWYEAAPYVYLVVGLVSASFSNSDVGFVFSALLLTATFTIVRRRRIHRSPEQREYRKYSRPQ